MNNNTLENLQLAYDRLIVVAEYYPEIKKDFNMETFGCYEYLDKQSLHKCSTRGCLLGNMALVLPILDSLFNMVGDFSYLHFGTHYFPDLYSGGNQENRLWYYLFGWDWEHTYPSFDDAMTRLKHFIDKEGKIDWHKDYTTLLP